MCSYVTIIIIIIHPFLSCHKVVTSEAFICGIDLDTMLCPCFHLSFSLEVFPFQFWGNVGETQSILFSEVTHIV